MNKNTPFAREGYPFIAFSLGLTLLLALSAWKLCSIVLVIPAVISLLLTGFVLYFFRNPERTPPADERAVVAPADGTVIVVERVPETPLKCEALKISIFMSVFNVHVNRVPFNGTVLETNYECGKFYDARDGRASCENERNGIVLETDRGVRMAFVQIAGLIARRIVSYPRVGDRLIRGERYGLIRFGSRVDVYLPADAAPEVKLGDTTVAGETVLARIG
ncbi:phosphatidylserine decarboxylase family protein [Geobacter sp. SVR]|uniref:phosphatidylserine decarboxylase family protein n=1 Tax=Geobacter sp. SVR TaxID=2495594 RepID=UPI00143F0013|nr:phosphatidylserine decarboxylase family protein [Geobacter sp. SVR]BCS54491.1 phosphatidylserine decarboxylase proenzyme [Geobacter sp. SVR]GCF87091.1 phosphatidylserine decarboxylase proenzyme [Geobacter sp. SVR]